MNEHERRRRTMAAQGFAAMALVVFAHGAKAATTPSHPASPPQPAAACQVRAA
jgi:hypothetical protein